MSDSLCNCGYPHEGHLSGCPGIELDETNFQKYGLIEKPPSPVPPTPKTDRFSLYAQSDGCIDEREHPGGEWVRAVDYERSLAAATAEATERNEIITEIAQSIAPGFDAATSDLRALRMLATDAKRFREQLNASADLASAMHGMTIERDDLQARESALRAALGGLLARYVGLVESGDAGNWDAEKESEVIAAREALAPQASQASPWRPISSLSYKVEGEVLLFSKTYGQMIGRTSWEQGSNPEHIRVGTARYEYPDFTHWQPLPTPPEA